MDPPCSVRVPRARTYSRPHQLRQYRAVTFFGPAFQPVHAATGLSAFDRLYSRSRGCFPFLWLLRCFSSPGSLHTPMHSACDDPQRAGLPHSEIPGSQLGYQLLWAYRRFPRLSSPLDAKTSTVRPCSLDHANRTPPTLADDPAWSRSRRQTHTFPPPTCVGSGRLLTKIASSVRLISDSHPSRKWTKSAWKTPMRRRKTQSTARRTRQSRSYPVAKEP